MSHSKIAKLVADVSKELQINIPDMDKQAIMQEVRKLVKTNHPIPELMNSDSDQDQGSSSDVEFIDMEDKNKLVEDVIEIPSDADSQDEDVDGSEEETNLKKIDAVEENENHEREITDAKSIFADTINVIKKNKTISARRMKFYKRNPWLTRGRKKRRILSSRKHLQMLLKKQGQKFVITEKTDSWENSYNNVSLTRTASGVKKESSPVRSELSGGPDTRSFSKIISSLKEEPITTCEKPVGIKSEIERDSFYSPLPRKKSVEIIKSSMKKYPGVNLKNLTVNLQKCIQENTCTNTRGEEQLVKCGVSSVERMNEKFKKANLQTPIQVVPNRLESDYIKELLSPSNQQIAFNRKKKRRVEDIDSKRMNTSPSTSYYKGLLHQNKSKNRKPSLVISERVSPEIESSMDSLEGNFHVEKGENSDNEVPPLLDPTTGEFIFEDQSVLDPTTGELIFEDRTKRIKHEQKDPYFDSLEQSEHKDNSGTSNHEDETTQDRFKSGSTTPSTELYSESTDDDTPIEIKATDTGFDVKDTVTGLDVGSNLSKKLNLKSKDWKYYKSALADRVSRIEKLMGTITAESGEIDNVNLSALEKARAELESVKEQTGLKDSIDKHVEDDSMTQGSCSLHDSREEKNSPGDVSVSDSSGIMDVQNSIGKELESRGFKRKRKAINYSELANNKNDSDTDTDTDAPIWVDENTILNSIKNKEPFVKGRADLEFLSTFDMLIRRELYKTMLAPDASDEFDKTMPLILDVRSIPEVTTEKSKANKATKGRLRRKWMKIVNVVRFGNEKLDQINEARAQAKSLEYLRKRIFSSLKKHVNKSFTYESLCRLIMMHLSVILHREEEELTELNDKEVRKMMEEEDARQKRNMYSNKYISVQEKEAERLRNINLKETKLANQIKACKIKTEKSAAENRPACSTPEPIKEMISTIPDFLFSRSQDKDVMSTVEMVNDLIVKEVKRNERNEVHHEAISISGNMPSPLQPFSKENQGSNKGSLAPKVAYPSNNTAYSSTADLQRRCPLLFDKLQQHVQKSLAQSTGNLLSDTVRENLAYRIATSYANEHDADFRALEEKAFKECQENNSSHGLPVKDEPVDDFIVEQNIDDEDDESPTGDTLDSSKGNTHGVFPLELSRATSAPPPYPSEGRTETHSPSEAGGVKTIVIKEEPMEIKTEKESIEPPPLRQFQSIDASFPSISQFVAKELPALHYVQQSARFKRVLVPHSERVIPAPNPTTSLAKSRLAEKLKKNGTFSQTASTPGNMIQALPLYTAPQVLNPLQFSSIPQNVIPVMSASNSIVTAQASQAPMVNFYVPQSAQPGTATTVLPQNGNQAVGVAPIAATNVSPQTILQPAMLPGMSQPVLVPVVNPLYCTPAIVSQSVSGQTPTNVAVASGQAVPSTSPAPAFPVTSMPLLSLSAPKMPIKPCMTPLPIGPPKTRVKRNRNPTPPPLDRAPLPVSLVGPLPTSLPSTPITAISTSPAPLQPIRPNTPSTPISLPQTPIPTSVSTAEKQSQDSLFYKLPIPNMQLADFLAMQLRAQIETANKIAENASPGALNLPFLNNNEEMMAALNAPILKAIDSPLLAALNSTVIKALEGSMGPPKTTEINPVSNLLAGSQKTGAPVTSSVGTMGLSVATTPSCSIPSATVTSASSLVSDDVTKVTGSVGTLSHTCVSSAPTKSMDVPSEKTPSESDEKNNSVLQAEDDSNSNSSEAEHSSDSEGTHPKNESKETDEQISKESVETTNEKDKDEITLKSKLDPNTSLEVPASAKTGSPLTCSEEMDSSDVTEEQGHNSLNTRQLTKSQTTENIGKEPSAANDGSESEIKAANADAEKSNDETNSECDSKNANIETDTTPSSPKTSNSTIAVSESEIKIVSYASLAPESTCLDTQVGTSIVNPNLPFGLATPVPIQTNLAAPLPIPTDIAAPIPIQPSLLAAPLDGAFRVTLPDETINKIIEDAIQNAGTTLTPKAQAMIKTQLDKIAQPKEMDKAPFDETSDEIKAEVMADLEKNSSEMPSSEDTVKDGFLTSSKTRRKNDPFYKLPSTGVYPIRTVNEDGTTSWTCTLCGKSFTRNFTYRRHADSHVLAKPWKCDICTKAFTDRRYLQKHMRWHTGKNLQYCRECGRAFSDELALSKHMRVHNTNKVFRCERCPKVFADAQTLKRHNQHVHDQKKTHKCELCSLSFVFKSHLEDHMMRHTGEKPHRCSICGKGFIQVGTRNRHERMHKGGRNGNPYKCAICMNIFWFQDALRNHFFAMHPDIPVPEEHRALFKQVEFARQHENVSQQETKIRVEHIPRERYPLSADDSDDTLSQLQNKTVTEVSPEQVFSPDCLGAGVEDSKSQLRRLLFSTACPEGPVVSNRIIDNVDNDSKEHLKHLVEEQNEKEKNETDSRKQAHITALARMLERRKENSKTSAEEQGKKLQSQFALARMLEKKKRLSSLANDGEIVEQPSPNFSANSLDPDQDRQNVGPDLVPNCLKSSDKTDTDVSELVIDTEYMEPVVIKTEVTDDDSSNSTMLETTGDTMVATDDNVSQETESSSEMKDSDNQEISVEKILAVKTEGGNLQTSDKMQVQTDKIASLMELFRKEGVPKEEPATNEGSVESEGESV